MNKEELLTSRLSDAIEVELRIYCTKCKNVEREYFGDEFYWCDHLINLGWYATEKNIYCPSCNKKRKNK